MGKTVRIHVLSFSSAARVYLTAFLYFKPALFSQTFGREEAFSPLLPRKEPRKGVIVEKKNVMDSSNCQRHSTVPAKNSLKPWYM